MIRPYRWFAIPGHPRAAAWSPDGARVAVAIEDSGVLVAEVAGGEALRAPRAPVGTMVWTPAGLLAADAKKTARIDRGRASGVGPGGLLAAGDGLLVRASERGLEVLDPATLAVKACWALPEEPQAVGVAHGRVLVGGRERAIALSPDTGAIRTVHGPWVRAFAATRDGQVLANTHEGAAIGPPDGPWRRLPERGALAAGDGWCSIGPVLFDPRGPRGEIRQRVEVAAGSPDGRRLLLADHEEAWLVDPGSWIAPIGARGDVDGVACDGRRLATCDRTGAVVVWEDGRIVASFHGGQSLEGASIALDGDRLYVAREGVQVWSLPDGARIASWRFDDLGSTRRAERRGDRILVVGSFRVVVADLDGRPVAAAGPWPDRYGHQQLDDADLADDGRTLVVAISRHGETSRVVDLETGEQVASWPRADRVVALSGGRFALSGGDGPEIRRWPDGESQPIDRFHDGVRSGDGFTWCEQRVVGAVPADGPPHAHRFADDVLAVGATAERWWCGGRSGRVAERDARSGKLLRVLASEAGDKITAVAFDPTGRWLAVGEYHRLHLWALGDRPQRVAVVDATRWRDPETAIDDDQLAGIESIWLGEGLVIVGGRTLRWPALGPEIARTRPLVAAEHASAISADGKLLLTGGGWGQEVVLRDWDGTERWRRPGVDGRERWVELARDRVLVGRSGDGATEATVYDLRGEPLGVLSIAKQAQVLALDPMGRVVGLVEEGPALRWDPAGTSVERWLAGEHTAREIVFGGGRALLGGRWLVDAEHGGRLVLLHGPARHGRTAAAISHDGRLVAVADWSGTVDLFDGDGRRVATLGHTSVGGWWREQDGERVHDPGYAATFDWSTLPDAPLEEEVEDDLLDDDDWLPGGEE